MLFPHDNFLLSVPQDLFQLIIGDEPSVLAVCLEQRQVCDARLEVLGASVGLLQGGMPFGHVVGWGCVLDFVAGEVDAALFCCAGGQARMFCLYQLRELGLLIRAQTFMGGGLVVCRE